MPGTVETGEDPGVISLPYGMSESLSDLDMNHSG